MIKNFSPECNARSETAALFFFDCGGKVGHVRRREIQCKNERVGDEVRRARD